MFPVPFRIVFSHPTQVSQTDIEVSNGVVSNFKQESTTDLLVEVTPKRQVRSRWRSPAPSTP